MYIILFRCTYRPFFFIDIQMLPNLTQMDLGNVIPSWQKRYPFSLRNMTSADIKMKLSLNSRDEGSLDFVQILDSMVIRRLSSRFDISRDIHSDLYEFTLGPNSVERFVLVFSCHESHDASLYHDVWMEISPKLGKPGPY
jgi:hypothetical protein